MDADYVVKSADLKPMHDPRYGTVRVATGEGPLLKLDLAYATVLPGAASPPHYHELTEEAYCITSGDGVMAINNHEIPVNPGDLVRIPRGAVHTIRAGVGGIEFWVATSPPYCIGDDIEVAEGSEKQAASLRIAVLAGTHRPGAVSLMLAKQLCRFYSESGVDLYLINPAELSPDIFSTAAFDHRYETDGVLAKRFIKADGLVVVTPEYNGSFPGIIKHILDIQPYRACFQNKPVAFVGVAAGEWGGLRAVEQLQSVFSYRNAFVFPERVFIRNVEDLRRDENGEIADPEIVARLKSQTANFLRFVKCLHSY